MEITIGFRRESGHDLAPSYFVVLLQQLRCVDSAVHVSANQVSNAAGRSTIIRLVRVGSLFDLLLFLLNLFLLSLFVFLLPSPLFIFRRFSEQFYFFLVELFNNFLLVSPWDNIFSFVDKVVELEVVALLHNLGFILLPETINYLFNIFIGDDNANSTCFLELFEVNVSALAHRLVLPLKILDSLV